MKNTNKDLEHLRWLAIFHYVGAGIAFLFIGFTLLQFYGSFQQAKEIMEGKNNNPSVINEIGIVVAVFAGIYLIIEVIRIVSMILAGRFLQLHKNRIFCMVVAGINCAFFPIGTVLGVFTLVVLFRDSVKQLFFEKTIISSEN